MIYLVIADESSGAVFIVETAHPVESSKEVEFVVDSLAAVGVGSVASGLTVVREQCSVPEVRVEADARPAVANQPPGVSAVFVQLTVTLIYMR